MGPLGVGVAPAARESGQWDAIGWREAMSAQGELDEVEGEMAVRCEAGFGQWFVECVWTEEDGVQSVGGVELFR